MTAARAVAAVLLTIALGLAVTAVLGWGWWTAAVIVVAAVIGSRWAAPGDTP